MASHNSDRELWENETGEHWPPPDEDFDDGSTPEWCHWCGGDGWDFECHEEGCYCLEGHECSSCRGSGLAKDMTIW